MNLATRSVSFADLEMRAIRRSHIEAWVKAMLAATVRRCVQARAPSHSDLPVHPL